MITTLSSDYLERKMSRVAHETNATELKVKVGDKLELVTVNWVGNNITGFTPNADVLVSLGTGVIEVTSSSA
jgi:hypothetical protein